MGALPFLDLPRVRRAQGVMALPGSKSISNRVLLLAAIAEGETAITGLLDSDDTRVMLAALRQLGVAVSELAEGRVTVSGVSRFPVDSADLFMGNAGTAIRPLTAALALMGGDYRLSGVPRMHERPIGDLVDALKALGARIDYLGQPGYPPLHIGRGEIATPAVTQVQGSVSSQFLTALLMAAPLQAGQSGQPVVIEVLGELISKP
ncbi:3-phosphoshikimate 1-carboxyvinyltransferase, partial [Achromobacter ruhlandii]|nr:3-phosphoshikimate 1-carboxyvinyltransferase [Achromobacter ruhlandii]